MDDKQRALNHASSLGIAPALENQFSSICVSALSSSFITVCFILDCISFIRANSLNDSGMRGKNEERSARRSTECSTSFRTSNFIPKTDFMGRFDEIKIKPNDLFKNFNSTFGKNDVVL
ncbi:hypothetical protein R6Q57_010044 [Mikania cordata]